MGSLYRRKDSPFFWLGYTDAYGTRVAVSSGTADEEEAKKRLAAAERREKAIAASGLAKAGPVTVRRYSEKWIAERRERRVASADDDEARLAHALPSLGKLPLGEVRPQHLRDLVRSLEREGRLAPRTILHVYGVLRVMFSDAVTEELIPATPCVLRVRRGELPKKRDKDPRWRTSALYERHEVEALISDARLSERHRVLYAIEFLCGVRVNEVTPRRWSDYDPEAKPLGRLTFATSYAYKRKEEKSTKTGNAREVPVHPTLAKVLARWKLSGWAETFGRAPGPNDLLVPSARGNLLSSASELKRLHENLELLGLRKRRQHDFRRTFVTLGQMDGGRREVLETITHDPKGDVFSLYTSFPWPTRCEEVAKLNIRLREGQVLPLPQQDAATPVLRDSEVPTMTEEKFGGGGNRRRLPPLSGAGGGDVSTQEDGTSGVSSVVVLSHATSQRSGVAGPDDYEARARALGFTLVYSSEG